MSRSTALILVAMLGAGGCVQSVRRAALVPHQQPVARSGQPMTADRELVLGSPTVASAGAPEEVSDSNAGVEIPRWHFDGAFRFNKGNMDVGLRVDWGLDNGARAVRDDQPKVDNGDVVGGGLTLYFSQELSPQLRIGFGFEALIYSIPWVEYRTEVNGLFSVVDEERDLMAVLGAAIIPSFRIASNVVLFGGLTVRNHPTIDRSDLEVTGVFNDDDEVEFGPANLTASVGAEIEMGGGSRLMLYAFQPVHMDPVKYKPAVGIAVAIPLGRKPTHAQPTPIPAPPAGPAGPAGPAAPPAPAPSPAPTAPPAPPPVPTAPPAPQ